MNNVRNEEIMFRVNKYWKSRGIDAGARMAQASHYREPRFIVASNLTGFEHDPTAEASFHKAQEMAIRYRKMRTS